MTTTVDDRLVPPHSLEAERSVLGAILLSDHAMYGLVIEDGLRPDDFYREQHRRVYEAMHELYAESKPVDILTVTDRLRGKGTLQEAGGEVGVHALAGSVLAAGNVRHYAQIVRENALMRRLLSTAHQIQASVAGREYPPRELVENAERAMLEVAHDDRQKDFRGSPTSCTPSSRSSSASPRSPRRSPAPRPATATSTTSPAASSPATHRPRRTPIDGEMPPRLSLGLRASDGNPAAHRRGRRGG